MLRRKAAAGAAVLALLAVGAPREGAAEKFAGAPGARCSTMCASAKSAVEARCAAGGGKAVMSSCTCDEKASPPFANVDSTCQKAEPAKAVSVPMHGALRGAGFFKHRVGETDVTFFARWELDTLLGEPTVLCEVAWFLSEDAKIPGGSLSDLPTIQWRELHLRDVDLSIELRSGVKPLGTVTCDAGALAVR